MQDCGVKRVHGLVGAEIDIAVMHDALDSDGNSGGRRIREGSSLSSEVGYSYRNNRETSIGFVREVIWYCF